MTELDRNTKRIGNQPIGADYNQNMLKFLDAEFAKPEPPIKKFLGKVIPLFGIIKGLNMTRAAMLHAPKMTIKYPEEKLPVAKGFRGKHELFTDPGGEQLCICCNACANICPIGCIDLKFEASKTPEKRKRDLVEYNVNLTTCLFCGLCEEACPEFCLVLGPDYEYSDATRDESSLLRVKKEDIERRVTDEEWRAIQAEKAKKKKPKPAKKPAQVSKDKPVTRFDKVDKPETKPEPGSEKKDIKDNGTDS